MDEIDLSKIKYYPDRFYICLDGFDSTNLTSFITDLDIGQQQAIFIHEYYHFLTNITTYSGVRQFNLNFGDRFRLVVNMGYSEGITAFPIGNAASNQHNCVQYWNQVRTILDDDDIDYDLVKEVAQSARNKFDIVSVQNIRKPMSAVTDGETVHGYRELVEIQISGLTYRTDFILTYGAIDEFLSSAIDEFLYQNGLSDIDPRVLSQRPYYPYGVFDDLIMHYTGERTEVFEKVILAYFALNSDNPAQKLISILEQFKNGDYLQFKEDPEKYLNQFIDITPKHDDMISYTRKFADETGGQGRIHISQSIKYYHDKFFFAKKLKDEDFFYFIRPFFEKGTDEIRGKQRFLLALARIINPFTPPVFLENGIFKVTDKLTTFGEATVLILACFEIFESLKTEKYAKRPQYLRDKYIFPDQVVDCDDISTYQIPINGIAFQLALNEMGLFKIYIDDRDLQNP
ncbi:hypothetical protein [Flavobacterium sp.]|uniref:hypothetical protein n=1 Tax=Flavobacterium sp. TaxID=239 RepID=UPI0026180BE3|nr:hypothetical protein [Flavobacterium sp.]